MFDSCLSEFDAGGVRGKFNGLLVTTLSACGFLGGEEGQAKKAVRAVLKDPDSAKFGAFTKFDQNEACLTVNAKNSLGGYTGDQMIYLKKDHDGKWTVASSGELGHGLCQLKVMTMKGKS